jgi:hypothetical protein
VSDGAVAIGKMNTLLLDVLHCTFWQDRSDRRFLNNNIGLFVPPVSIT